MTEVVEEVVWHKDGHMIYAQINKSDLVITSVHCPGHEERECKLGSFDCIVTWFLETYGMECNVGICDPSRELEIAWSAVGDFSDSSMCQVWVIPTEDEAFAAWLVTQS
jgi:hypothetical protein